MSEPRQTQLEPPSGEFSSSERRLSPANEVLDLEHCVNYLFNAKVETSKTKRKQSADLGQEVLELKNEIKSLKQAGEQRGIKTHAKRLKTLENKVKKLQTTDHEFIHDCSKDWKDLSTRFAAQQNVIDEFHTDIERFRSDATALQGNGKKRDKANENLKDEIRVITEGHNHLCDDLNRHRSYVDGQITARQERQSRADDALAAMSARLEALETEIVTLKYDVANSQDRVQAGVLSAARLELLEVQLARDKENDLALLSALEHRVKTLEQKLQTLEGKQGKTDVVLIRVVQYLAQQQNQGSEEETTPPYA